MTLNRTRPAPTPSADVPQHWRLGRSRVLVRWCGGGTAPVPAGLRSGRSPTWAGRWTMTRCSSAMSPTRTADDAQGKVEVGGHLGDGQDVVAEGGDGPLLHGQLRRLLPDRGGRDQRLRLQVVVGGAGTPAGHGRTRCGSGAGWS